MKRSTGVRLLSVLLATLSISSFANGYKIFSGSAWGTLLSAVLAVLSGIAAVVAAVGLWRMQKWAYAAFLAWVVVVWALAFSFIPYFPIANGVILLAFLASILWCVVRYVRKILAISL